MVFIEKRMKYFMYEKQVSNIPVIKMFYKLIFCKYYTGICNLGKVSSNL